MNQAPKTRDEAIALPAITFSEMLKKKQLGNHGLSGDDIVIFTDATGEAWRVVDLDSGFYKMRF